MSFKPATGFILACIFLNALGIGLIVPVLPRLVGTLTHSADAQTLWYGALMVSYGVMQFASSPFLGAVSDRIGRRPVLLGGICGLGLMFAVAAWADNLWLILVSRIAGGMLSANMAVAQAYVVDISEPEQRAAGFGRIGAVFGIGFVLGPVAGGVLGADDPSLPFAAAAAVCLVNFIYGLAVLPESLATPNHHPLTLRANNPFASIAGLLRPRQCRGLVLILMTTALANALTQCTWALYTEYRYGFTPLEIGLSVFALGLSISFVQGVVLQRALTRHEPETIVKTTLAIGAAALAGIALVPDGLAATVLFCVYTAAGCVAPLLKSLITRFSPMTTQGKTIGSLSSLNSLTSAAAPVLGTPLLMATTAHPTGIVGGAPYLAGALLLAAALVLFVRCLRRLRDESRVRLPLDDEDL